MEILSTRGEQIVDVAIKLLSEGGISVLTTKKLAESVGISEAALYRHFKGKLDILVAILDRLEVNMGSLFAQGLSKGDSVLDQVEMVHKRVFHNFSARPAMASVVFSEEMFRHDPRLSERVSRIMDTVQENIMRLLRSKKGREECRCDVPVKDLARIIMGALRFIVTRWRLSGHDFDLEKEGLAFWQSLRLMIAAPTE
jgi:AcrR family transcriptional regulator